ncbi:MAG: LCP family protein, partial [Actinomycetota bacterium]|nr:LCP family protein [Actinomycetota bacterium]
APVKDKDSGANFPAGRQNLSGAAALAFVRQRKGLPNGDIDRVARQQVFLAGMARKAFSADLLAPGSETMTKLQRAVTKSVVLDQGWNIVEFAQQMVDFTGGNLTFQTIPHGDIGMPTPDGKAVEVDPAEVKDFVRGVIPDDDATTEAPADGTPAPGSITVNVRNAAQVDGLAGDVADTLTDAGFAIGLVDDATTRDTTVIRHAPGERAAADLVTASLTGPATAEEDANQRPGQVTVLLGQDYPTTDGVARPGLVDLGVVRQPGDPVPVAEGTCVH